MTWRLLASQNNLSTKLFQSTNPDDTSITGEIWSTAHFVEPAHSPQAPQQYWTAFFLARAPSLLYFGTSRLTFPITSLTIGDLANCLLKAPRMHAFSLYGGLFF